MGPGIEVSKKRRRDSNERINEETITSNVSKGKSRNVSRDSDTVSTPHARKFHSTPRYRSIRTVTVSTDVSKLEKSRKVPRHEGQPPYKRIRDDRVSSDADAEDAEDEQSDDRWIKFTDVPLPIKFLDISQRLVGKGYRAPDHVCIDRELIPVSVTKRGSAALHGQAFSINLDQPLLHFYHSTFVPSFPPGDYHEDLIPDDPLNKDFSNIPEGTSSAKIHELALSKEDAYEKWFLMEAPEEYPSGNETEESYETATDYEDAYMGDGDWDDSFMELSQNPFDGLPCCHYDGDNVSEGGHSASSSAHEHGRDAFLTYGMYTSDPEEDMYDVDPPSPPEGYFMEQMRLEQEERREDRRMKREIDMKERRKVWWKKQREKQEANKKRRGEIMKMDARGDLMKDYRIVFGGVEVGFRRCVRVPDRDKAHQGNAHMDLGSYKVFNVADYADRLPKQIIKRGGVFTSIHNCEALSISLARVRYEEGFTPLDLFGERAFQVVVEGAHASRAGAGGAGAGRCPSVMQNKLITGELKKFKWLNGIPTDAPDIVQQFGATLRSESKHSGARRQASDTNNIENIQITIFPRYPETLRFTLKPPEANLSCIKTVQQFGLRSQEKTLDIYSTPKQLGLKEGDVIWLEDLGMPEHVWLRGGPSDPACADFNAPELNLRAFSKPGNGFHVWVTNTSSSHPRIFQRIDCNPDTRIKEVTSMYEGVVGSILASRWYSVRKRGNKELDLNKALKDYNFKSGDTISIAEITPEVTLDPSEVQARSSEGTEGRRLPTMAYSPEPIAQLNISIFSASMFSNIMGRPPPVTPVSSMTFEYLKLQWPEEYGNPLPITGADENVCSSKAKRGGAGTCKDGHVALLKQLAGGEAVVSFMTA